MKPRRAVVVLTLALAACRPASGQERPAMDDAVVREASSGPSRQVTTAELRDLAARGAAVLLDARPREEFAMSHIPGAVNVGQKPGAPMSAYVPDVADVMRLVPDRQRTLIVYCNGPFCGKSRRFAEELASEGYRDVRRYQLGMPGWRLAGGAAAIEASAIARVAELDGTAVFVDAGVAAGAVHLPRLVTLRPGDVVQAKDDGRLPMTDHNTRIVVVGRNGMEARRLAEALTANAFHNVAYFDGDGALLDRSAR